MTMTQFSDDTRWLEAKKVIGFNNSWLKVLEYYKSIGGDNVFVYCIGDGNKNLIVDIQEDKVVLMDKRGNLFFEETENVINSRKEFKYSTDIETKELSLESQSYNVVMEK